MIDPENEVYTILAQALREEFPGISISDDPMSIPASFPHVSIEMSNNTTLFKVTDSGNYEVAICIFEINVYSNKQTGRKTECRKIANFIDTILVRKNFRRQAMTPITNRDNPAVYRIAARYRVATDGKFFYRR